MAGKTDSKVQKSRGRSEQQSRRTPIQTVVTSTFAETRQEGGFEFTEFYSAAWMKKNSYNENQ